MALRVAELEVGGGRVAISLDTLHASLGALGTRLEALEVRAPLPGPPGPPGRDGLDGKDGLPGLQYLGVHVAGKTYDPGDVVTAGGSAWHCSRPTTGTPGTSAD
jgi:hypothetical protein